MVTSLIGVKAVVAKLGMDAHWRGAIVIANAFRDAGMDVVYLGHATTQQVAAAAIQEDAVLVGLSTLSGNHLEEVPSVVAAIRAAGGTPVVVVGGAIPRGDQEALRAAGVDGVFPTGSSLPSILADLADLLTHKG